MSEETKFTAGPWRADTRYESPEIVPFEHDSSVPVIFSYGERRGDVAYLCNSLRRGEELAANAHLIAASPDMYGMLNHLREYFDNRADADQPFGAPRPIPNLEMEYLMEIDEVLAAARGESQ